MITNARVLQPEFVPQDVVHRNQEIHHLSAALRPITDERPGQYAFLSGPSGAGKTCLARYAVDELREEVLDLNTQYVNCWEDYSRFKVLYRVLEGLDQALDIHRQSTATDTLVDRLHTYDGPPYVVILDEVDQLHEQEVLYDLDRTPGLTLVLIENEEEEFFSQLDGRLASRFQSSAKIRFSPYTNDELVSILEDRVRWGLNPDVIDAEQLAVISDTAAGDARVAISILRSAAGRADHEGYDTITDEVIGSVIPEAKAELRKKNIQKLTPDQKLLYDILTEHGELSAGDLYDRYVERAEEPKTKRMVRNYLSKMQHYNLVVAEGENRGRTYSIL